MKNKHTYRDIGITIAVTIVIVSICIIAIFGLPSNKEKSKLPDYENISLDTTQALDMQIPDYEPPVPIVTSDTTDTDTVSASVNTNVNDSI